MSSPTPLDPLETPYVHEFEKTLKEWSDERFVSQEQIRALALFSLYIVNLADADGWQYYGHSFKASSPMAILVIKATLDDIPVVCFNSGRTFCSCAKIFIRKIETGVVEWRPDQYRA